MLRERAHGILCGTDSLLGEDSEVTQWPLAVEGYIVSDLESVLDIG